MPPPETRLHRRPNGRYYFRAWVPDDLRELIPGGRSGQKWIALGTSDLAEAKRLIRIRSVEFDKEIEAARRRAAGEVTELSRAEIERLASAWYSDLLEEDEEARMEGLSDRGLLKKRESVAWCEAALIDELPKGDFSGLEFDIEDFLGIQGVHVPKGTETWNRIGFAFLKAWKRYITAVRQRNEGELIETPSLPKATDSKRSCTVEELIQGYLNDPTRKRSASTLKTYNTVFRAMRELFGPDTPVDSIHRRDCERIRDVLMRLPKNAKTRFPDMLLEDAAKLAEAEGLDRIGVSAVNCYLHNLSALFKWGVKNWRADRNPAEGLALLDDRDERDMRQSFSPAHLTAIFNAPLYTGCENDEKGFAKPGPHVIRRGRFWVPLLSLWTGMRLGECCQLRVQDVTEYEGVPVILIDDTSEPGEDEADRKRVKTKAGKRFVPVHPELECIGLLAFVEEMRAKGEKRLFPEIKPDTVGYLSGSFSKWFNDRRRFLGKLGLAATGVSFHSFRHNYRDALREADISLERVRALGGWRRDSDGEESRYGSGLSAETLYREIKKIRYPELDLSHLHT